MDPSPNVQIVRPWIYTLAGGKVVRAEAYKSTAEAEAAFGARGNGASAVS